jgi:predicted RNase H-like HicB family nuclease
MMKKGSIYVRARWDAEAGMWVATSEDIPGLVTEAPTQQELLDRLLVMIPELIEADKELQEEFALPEVPLVVMHERLTKVRLRA